MYNWASSGLRKGPTMHSSCSDRYGRPLRDRPRRNSFGSPWEEYYYDFRQSFNVVPERESKSDIPSSTLRTASHSNRLYWRLIPVSTTPSCRPRPRRRSSGDFALDWMRIWTSTFIYSFYKLSHPIEWRRTRKRNNSPTEVLFDRPLGIYWRPQGA